MTQINPQGRVSQSGKLRIVVEPAGPPSELLEAVKRRLLDSSALRALTQGKQCRLLHFKVVEKSGNDKSQLAPLDHFEATLYNYSDNYAIIARGRLDAAHEPQVVKSAAQPLPSAEELQEAYALASRHTHIKQLMDAGRVSLFPAMPAVIARLLPDGRTERIIPLTLSPRSKQDVHEVIGVNLGDGQVIRALDWREARPELFDHLIFPVPMGWPFLFPQDDNQQVWFTVYDAFTEEVLWRMLVVRPSASSGTNGSGLELRYVDYRGQRVLYQAHLPILNVRYNGITLQYRDWTTSEAGFDATGTPFQDANGNNLPGFSYCSTPPQTIFETGHDGSFYGVAFYENADGSWTLSTMMQAGWYRYYMAYTFSADGTIRPRVGFTTDGSNPYASNTHVHHAYFRFDFDIGQFWNDVVESVDVLVFIDPATGQLKFEVFDVPIAFEEKLYRTGLFPSYIVREKGTNRGYRLAHGTHDGTAQNDSYGKGDIWALRYHSSEIDDHVQMLTVPSEEQIDNFINGESVDGADVVVWYAVHFTHDPQVTTGEKDFGPIMYSLR